MSNPLGRGGCHKISRKHATLEYCNSSEAYLTDHKSRNGTFYKGIEIINKQKIILPKQGLAELLLGSVKIGVVLRDDNAEKAKIRKESTEININDNNPQE